jgi:hypothetical protein
MARLPPLVNLRIQEDVGVVLALAKANPPVKAAAKAARRGGGKSRVDKDGAVAMDVGSDVGSDALEASGKTQMESLIDELKKDFSDLVAQWRISLQTNMQNKRRQYIEKQNKINLKRSTELKRLDFVWATLRGKGSRSDLEDYERNRVVLETKSGGDGNFDVSKHETLDTGALRGLAMAQEAAMKITSDIDEVLEKVGREATWRQRVADFINALQKLLDDYPDQTVLLQKTVTIVRTFIKAPLALSKQFLNMIITGDAGTGKTRLAETVGPVFARLGLYVYDELVIASSNDFIAPYEGQTEQKTADFLSKHAEKVIFLDEAYSLTLWEEKVPGRRQLAGYSPEAVPQLVAVLSQSVGQFMFIAAGYEHEMQNDFLAANPGFDRRFPIRVALGAPSEHALVRVFFNAIAEAVVGSEPSEDYAEWALKKFKVAKGVRHWFTPSAVCLLCNVLQGVATDAEYCSGNRDEGKEGTACYDSTALSRVANTAAASDEEAYGTAESDQASCYFYELFSAGAGAMVNFAGTAALLIMSNPHFEFLYHKDESLRRVIDHTGMRQLLIAFIEDRYSQSGDAAHAVLELDNTLLHGWGTHQEDGNFKWLDTLPLPCTVSALDVKTTPPLEAGDIKLGGSRSTAASPDLLNAIVTFAESVPDHPPNPASSAARKRKK